MIFMILIVFVESWCVCMYSCSVFQKTQIYNACIDVKVLKTFISDRYLLFLTDFNHLFRCIRITQSVAATLKIVAQSICTHYSSLSGWSDIFLGSGPLFTGSQTDPCFQKKTMSPRKPPGSYKKFQGRNPYNIFVAILVKMMTPKRHFEIN